jgi:hypothetical protein
MPEIITCPSCQRKLQVPEEYFGKLVQCPECKQTFTAAPSAPAAPPAASAAPAAAEPTSVPAAEAEPLPPPVRERRRFADDEDDRPRRRPRRFEDDDDYDDRPPRRFVAPHRGGLILTFGILGLVVPCASVIFGPIAWIMGNTDLGQIRAGTMDPAGEGLTQAGRVLGIVSTVMTLAGLGLFCLMFMVSAGRRF